MFATSILLLVSSLASFRPTVLILKSGGRYDVRGAIQEQAGKVRFHLASSGALYEIPLTEIDVPATESLARQQSEPRAEAPEPQPQLSEKSEPLKLRVTPEKRDELLKQLEQNHSGVPAPPGATVDVTAPDPALRDNSPEEWEWRSRARRYQEAVRRAREDLQLLQNRIEALQSKILRLTSLGFPPRQFTYETSELQLAREEVPAAELRVARAERDYAQFLDDARRLGVLPGWLR